jgi:glycosyltransferase involved in cell wall biosynthesis
MKVTLVSQADGGGGAARAAYRLHRSLIDADVNCRMRVARKTTDDPHVVTSCGRASRVFDLIRPKLGALPEKLRQSSNPIHHSLAWVPSRLSDDPLLQDADVVNLHWVGHEFMSINDVGRIKQPTVWTLHDSWAFCGSEHHPDGPGDDRYIRGYLRGTSRPGDSGLDLDRWTWVRKYRAWSERRVVISPSRWLADCAQRSKLMRDWPIHVVPNPLQVMLYRPWPRNIARELFRLPTDAPIVLFGAVGGTGNSSKGGDLLWPALRLLGQSLPTCHAVVLGESAPMEPRQVGMPVHYIGKLQDDQALAMLYSAADLVVIPSRMENLPQSGTEALSCGTPVVAFDCSGLPDVVQHKETGYLARPYDVTDLATGMLWILEDPARHRGLCDAARRYAVSHWAPEVVVPRYLDLFAAAVDLQREKS